MSLKTLSTTFVWNTVGFFINEKYIKHNRPYAETLSSLNPDCGNHCLVNPNTGLVSVPFSPLLTGVWDGIVELFKWAAIGETRGHFFMGGGSK